MKKLGNIGFVAMAYNEMIRISKKCKNLAYQTENIAFDVFITMKLKIMNSSSLSFSTAFNIDWIKIATQRNGLYIESTE